MKRYWKNSFKMVTIEAYFIHLYLKWNDNKSDDNNNNVFQKCNCFTQVPSLSLLHIFLSKLREEDTVSFTIMCWKRGVSKVSILMIFSCPANGSSIRTCPCWLTDWEKKAILGTSSQFQTLKTMTKTVGKDHDQRPWPRLWPWLWPMTMTKNMTVTVTVTDELWCQGSFALLQCYVLKINAWYVKAFGICFRKPDIINSKSVKIKTYLAHFHHQHVSCAGFSQRKRGKIFHSESQLFSGGRGLQAWAKKYWC